MFRFILTLPTTVTAASTADTVRIVIYHDKQANGGEGTEATLWQSSDDLTDYRNIQNAQRYRILMDKTISINSNGGSGQGTTAALSWAAKQISFDFYKDMAMPVYFTSTGAGVAELTSNNIGMCTISRNGLCQLQGTGRIRFTDS